MKQGLIYSRPGAVVYEQLTSEVTKHLNDRTVITPIDDLGYKDYVVHIRRVGSTKFRVLNNNQGSVPWNFIDRLVKKTFEEMGYTVRESIYAKTYTIVGQKAKFSFMMKYGKMDRNAELRLLRRR